MLEVVAKDEGIAGDIGLGDEREGDGVAIVGVLRGGEIR